MGPHYIFDRGQSGKFGFHLVGNEKPSYLLNINIYTKITITDIPIVAKPVNWRDKGQSRGRCNNPGKQS